MSLKLADLRLHWDYYPHKKTCKGEVSKVKFGSFLEFLQIKEDNKIVVRWKMTGNTLDLIFYDLTSGFQSKVIVNNLTDYDADRIVEFLMPHYKTLMENPILCR